MFLEGNMKQYEIRTADGNLHTDTVWSLGDVAEAAKTLNNITSIRVRHFGEREWNPSWAAEAARRFIDIYSR
jgi:hypothetical protein